MSSCISSSEENTLTPQRCFLPTAALTALGVLAVFWFISLNMRMGFLPAEYAMWQTRHQMITRCKLAPTVILGDSRAAAGFLPAKINGAVNFALGGATPVEMYYITKDLLKCREQPHRVIISLSPEMLMKSEFFWERTGLYGVLTYSQLDEIRRTSRALNDTSIYAPPKFADWDAILSNLLHAYRFPSFYTTYIIRHLAVGRLNANLAIAHETLIANGQHGYGTDSGSNDVAYDAAIHSFIPSELLREYLEHMLLVYAYRGINVDFVAVPMNQATYQQMSPDVIDGFQQFLETIAKSHNNFHLLGPAISSLDDRYFGDSTHLNRAGAAVFSSQINERLSQTSPDLHWEFSRLPDEATQANR